MGNSGTRATQSASPVQSVDRAVAILEILARDGEAGVTEVARELDVHKSTAYRLLAALDRGELVTQDTARGKFRLGVGIVRLAGAVSARLDVLQESRPVCRALAQEVGETVNLAILSGRDALYLDQVAGPAALSPHNWAGQRIPLHATSDGKVLLAYLPEADLAECLTPPLGRFTARTITDLARFPALLAGVRNRGGGTRGRADRRRGTGAQRRRRRGRLDQRLGSELPHPGRPHPGPGGRGPPRGGRGVPPPGLDRCLARASNRAIRLLDGKIST